MRTKLLALVALIPTPAAAFGPRIDSMIRDDDRVRLEQLDEVSGRTLRGAAALADPADVDVLVQGLRGTPLPLGEAASILPGNWSCRMLKLGRNLPLVIYQPFRCRIGADGSFEKLTGSQRMTGTIGVIKGREVYLGTGYVAGQEPLPYAQLPDEIDPTAIPQLVPEVGAVEVVSPARARILLPLPVLESEMNLLLLSR
ncbi:DUF4893 domain-containing protein [Paracoccus beibuensis]|uniref:DUF4893 domain-containing protein n=1 Tax=Paracoccus beibuensis TaxID=547602 RepID=UPI0022408B2C|nr:DUF4893 domain-containing protein [Paracoccus beibuensis]